MSARPPAESRFDFNRELGRKDALSQFTDVYDKPFGWVVTGRMAARIKEPVERFLVVGPLRLERLVPGAFMWRPALKARATPMADPRGTHET